VGNRKAHTGFWLLALAALGACANGVGQQEGTFNGSDAAAGTGSEAGAEPDASTPSDAAGTSPEASNSPDAASDSAIDALPDASTPPDASAMDSGSIDASPPSDASTVTALLAKWDFNEGTGTTSADLSGQGHTITLMGAASWSAEGKEGAALSLDGATGYADIGSTLIDTAQSFSVLCWAKLTVVNAWEVALSQDDVTGSLFGLKLRGDATNEFDFDVETSDTTNPGFVVAQSTATAVAATWVHLAGVYNATGTGTMTVYVNGAAQATAAVGQALGASNGHFVIGRGLYNTVTGSFVNGLIDEVEVHSGAMSGGGVAAIYTAEE
jgi:hypothetical protein